MAAWTQGFSLLLAQTDPMLGTPPAAPTAEVPVVSETDVARDLFTRAFEGDTAAMIDLGTRYILPAIVFLLILIVAYFVGKFLANASRKPIASRVDPTLAGFTSKVIFWAVMILALTMALPRIGVSVASFAALIAASGFAIGLAMQGSLSNFAAGIMLLAFRPFKVGDAVNAAGVTAKVYSIDLFYTVFDTFDNRRIIVPNSDILAGNIENITFHPERRDDVEVGVSYSADVDATRAALTRAAESVEGLVRGEGRGFEVFLKSLGGSSIDWVVRCWFPAPTFWDNHQLLVRAIKRELDTAGLEIPFPQMDIHLDDKRSA